MEDNKKYNILVAGIKDKNLIKIIDEAGYNVTGIGEIESVLENLNTKKKFHLLILPYHTDDCSSIKFLYHIKTANPYLEILFHSKKEIPYEHLAYAMDEGASGFLVTGMDHEKILNLIEKKIKISSQNQNLLIRTQILEAKVNLLEDDNQSIREKINDMELRLRNINLLVENIMERAEIYTCEKKILLVSDSMPQKQAISKYLQKVNIETEFASTIDETLITAHQLDPAVIVTDFQLEDGTGKELAERVKSEKAIKNPYVIIFTADIKIKQDLIAPLGPADDYLLKPSTKRGLSELLTSILSGFYTINRRATL